MTNASDGQFFYRQHSASMYQHAHRAVVWAMVFNFAVALFKLLIGLVLANSAALFSEGLHSLADGINSVFLLIGLTRGNRAPDRTHPYGYGLETNFWALIASFALFFSAGYAVYKGVDRLCHPETISHYWWAMLVLMVSIIWESFALYAACMAVLAELNMHATGLAAIFKAFRHIKQVGGPTTRFVFYEDGLAFLGGITALSAITLSQFAEAAGWMPRAYRHWPDAIASMLIGGMLLILAVNLLRYNRGFLTGSAASESVETLIRNLVCSMNEVSTLTELKTIDQGLSGLIVHLTVEVQPDIQVKDVDDLTDRIKQQIMRRLHTVQQVFIEVLADEKEADWSDRFYELIEQGKTEQVLRPREEMMLRNVFDFRELVARDVMVPRTDVEYVEIHTPLLEVADILIDCGHSKLPVYEDHVDNLVGVVHARDVYRAIRHQQSLDVPLRSLVRELDIYPENKPVSDLLEDFKRNKIYLAAVADEHGGFSGLVTLEDLMEEIVGELGDENEGESLVLEMLSPQQMVVSGKYESEALNERFGWSIPTDEFKTIGGFVFGQLGREPEAGDRISFEGLTIQVDQAEGPRITTLTIHADVPLDQQDHIKPV